MSQCGGQDAFQMCCRGFFWLRALALSLKGVRERRCSNLLVWFALMCEGPRWPPPGGVLKLKLQVRFVITRQNRRIVHTCVPSLMNANGLGN